ncbi:MAG: hypothetical protein IKZ43_03295 [Acidaminococcaceae bacterium]|nr:hypothetical protein [Acidaminococcaceae bacterium]
MKRWNEGAFFWAVMVLLSSVLFLYGTLVAPFESLDWQDVPILLAGTFPWTGLLLKSCKDGVSESRTEDLRRNLYFLLWAVTALAVSCQFHLQRVLGLVLSFPAFALLTGWNIDRMLREKGGRFTDWARVSVLTCVLAAAGCVWFVQSIPNLLFGGLVLGLVLLLMGTGIGIALLYYRDGVLAGWLHVATGALVMFILFFFLLPLADGFGAK